MLTKYQKFQVERIWRSTINLAHYNPRKIEAENRKKLTKNIKDEAGLVETIVVNRSTMNLVSGHQRLGIIDKLEGYPKKDYEIDVAMVVMTDEEERKQNVFMNAGGAQGEFDPELLKHLVTDSLEFSAEDFGLTDTDIALMGLSGEMAPVDESDIDAMFTKKGGTDEQREINKQNVKDMKKQISEKAGQKAADSALSYLVLNFSNYAEKSAFAKRFDLDPTDTYVDGKSFGEMVERIYED